MKCPILMTLIYKDVLKNLDPKYYQNIFPSDLEITKAINAYNLPEFYLYFSWKKDNLIKLHETFLNNPKDIIDKSVDYIKENNFPRYAILMLYGYLTYLTISKYLDYPELFEKYYLLNQGLNYKKAYKSLSKGKLKYDLAELQYLEFITRKIAKYPNVQDYYRNSSKNAYLYYHFYSASPNKIKTKFLRLLGKIFKKNYLLTVSKNLEFNVNIFDKITHETIILINELNKYLYFKNAKAFAEVFTHYVEKQIKF